MDQQEILAVHAMLQLIYHRNKNQHRRAKWWRWLSLLRRTTLDLGSQHMAAPAVSSYRQHLASYLIPKCYLAFSSVVADNQFSTLGVVLLAALSRASKAMAIKFERGVRPQPSVTQNLNATSSGEDRGERVIRGDVESLPEPNQTRQMLPKTVQNSAIDKIPNRKGMKKTSKRKKNAIDDLFSGLL
ncbi:hypothetical protein N7462_008790 [Penicillium macrosclerotiorum]|uniref:uncharacterized protein n=1 Tax=Penicillium macrosclerotiorum TaxID=303699 RepID=UPI0025498867|nr:uncharacterized protein N7462_008790 [Penicillium macrosclerotiorum]KAJ5675893.1 hypothetical protein N7462_008790 [Penicillium macrosclerotiorum]